MRTKIESARHLISVVALGCAFVPALRAELPAAPTPQNQPEAQPATSTAPVPAHANGIGDILFPDRFTVDPGVTTSPLSAKQKFGGYAREQLGLTPFLAAGISAGISQGLDTDPLYGQGSEAFAKRFGAIFAEGESVAFFRNALFPTLLHQDPRYYRLGEGSFTHRTFYAVSRALVTRQDSGRSAFNISAVGASAGAAALTLAYFPDRSQNGSVVAEAFGSNLGGIAATDFFREFGPDLKRKLFHRGN